MAEFVLSCGSTADLSKEHYEKRNIDCMFYPYSLGGEEYRDDLGQTIPYEDFYRRMAEGEMTSTAQINIGEYYDHFKEILETGRDVLHIVLSTGITGTFNSAVTAAEMLKEEFPDRKVLLVDSRGASGGYGLLMDKLADLRDEGMGLEELYEWAENNKLRAHHWFFSTDLQYYVRGGRITKAEGFFGTMLSICPLLNMDALGRLIPREKIRTKKRAIREIELKMEQFADGGLEYADKCFISHAGCYEDARAVADIIEERFPNLNGKVRIDYIGVIVGAHTGPGTVALFFWGDERVN